MGSEIRLLHSQECVCVECCGILCAFLWSAQETGGGEGGKGERVGGEGGRWDEREQRSGDKEGTLWEGVWMVVVRGSGSEWVSEGRRNLTGKESVKG